MAATGSHPAWLRPPGARWRVQLADAGVFLAILTTAGGASAWSLRWIAPIVHWAEPLRVLTRPGHTAALLLDGHGPAEAVILNSWPWLVPCMLVNALVLWGPLVLLRSARVRLMPVALWVMAALAATALMTLGSGWSPTG